MNTNNASLIQRAEYIDLHKQKHELDRGFCQGNSIRHHISKISSLISGSNIKTAIDYGCGKANTVKACNIQWLLELDALYLYDPAVDAYSTYPPQSADLVWCVDVMEHIPEDAVDAVLADIDSLANKAVFFCNKYTPCQ